MPGEAQTRKWYQPSLRDSFMFAGMMSGWAAYAIIERHIYPRPQLLEFLPILAALLGAGMGELVKRNRARNA